MISKIFISFLLLICFCNQNVNGSSKKPDSCAKSANSAAKIENENTITFFVCHAASKISLTLKKEETIKDVRTAYTNHRDYPYYGGTLRLQALITKFAVRGSGIGYTTYWETQPSKTKLGSIKDLEKNGLIAFYEKGENY